MPVQSPTALAPSGSPVRPDTVFTRSRRASLAGSCVGLALASEFTSGLVVAAICVCVFRMRREAWPRFLLGASLFLLLVPAYSWATVGSPFRLPYSFQASFPEMKDGLYGIQAPDGETALKLLFSPTRGLVFLSPFLAIAALGFAPLFRLSETAFWVMYAVPLLQVTVISGRVWDWQAGPAFGPRYLAPILPFLALPCALGLRRWPALGRLLCLCSIGLTTAATLTDACVDPVTHPNPLYAHNLPALFSGDLSPNLGTILGLSPFSSVLLYYAVLATGIWVLLKHGADALSLQAGNSESVPAPAPTPFPLEPVSDATFSGKEGR